MNNTQNTQHTKGSQVGVIINPGVVSQRDIYDMAELVQAIGKTVTSMSWGSHHWQKMTEGCLKWKVQGFKHKGHVYLVCNYSDLFDIYLTTQKGKIKKVIKNVYVDMLLNTLDQAIETPTN